MDASGASGAVAVSVSGDATFVTGGGIGSSHAYEPESIGRVRDLHAKINGVVGSLNDKVAALMRKQETEFLASYRAHMFQVQKELQQLRSKANEADLAMKRNEKIRALEEERNWYRKEALRLDKFATAMKKDLRFLKEKLEAIEDDRAWLERQLKGCKKSNKLLRAELEMRIAGEGGGGVPGSPDGEGGDARPAWTGGGSSSGLFPPATRALAAAAEAAGGGGGKPGGGGGGGRPGSGGGRPRPALGDAAAAASDAGEEAERVIAADGRTIGRLQGAVSRLEAALIAERQEVQALRAAAVGGASARGEMEVFFRRCLEDVRKEVSRRRMAGLAAAGKGPVAARALGSTGGSMDARRDAALARAERPDVSDFTATDRTALIRKLLADDYVLEALHRLIFGGGAEAAAGGGGGPATEGGDEGRRLVSPGGGLVVDVDGAGDGLDPSVQAYLAAGPARK